MIGIIGAMDEEIETLLKHIDETERISIAHVEFVVGTLYNKSVVIGYSGIGKVHAAHCVTLMIERFHVEKILFSGVAGGLHKTLSVGDVVLGEKLCYHDFDCSGLGYKKGVIPRAIASEFHSDPQLLSLAKNYLSKTQQNFVSGVIVSGDQFIGNKLEALKLVADFNADAVEMEGAAVAHIAALHNVPFLIIRLISDNANDAATSDYGKFIKKAVILANNIVLDIIKNC